MATKPSGLPTPPPSPRANSHEVARDKIRDWLPAAAGRSDPAGTAYTEIGPSSSSWRSTVSKKG
jgi:hypothetical protein